MEFHLVVVRAFGGHQVGGVIAGAEEIAAVLAGEQRRNVVRVVNKREG